MTLYEIQMNVPHGDNCFFSRIAIRIIQSKVGGLKDIVIDHDVLERGGNHALHAPASKMSIIPESFF